jgi:UDP-N-acetylmuramate dehydrogenase
VAPDHGLRVPVVILTGDLAQWEMDLDGVEAGAGAKLTQVCGSVARAGLSGMERLFGASGSVGGVVRADLECQSHLVRRILEWVETVVPGKPLMRVDRTGFEADGWFPDDSDGRAVIVRVRFGLDPDQPAAIQARISARDRHSGSRRSGSAAPVFKEPDGGSAQDLLVRSDCLRVKVGGARVSDQIPNAVVTSRMASSDDVRELCRTVRQRVFDRCGVTIDPALVFVDEHGRRFRI